MKAKLFLELTEDNFFLYLEKVTVYFIIQSLVRDSVLYATQLSMKRLLGPLLIKQNECICICGFMPNLYKKSWTVSNLRRTNELPTQKQFLPVTSNQEIGWFTKIQPLDPFRKDLRVNHPRHYSLSRYMDVFWSYYPPPIAKYHPKDN